MSDLTASAAIPKLAPTSPPELRDLAVAGRLDATAVLKLREAVEQAIADGPVTVLVDISGVSQVTASGMAGMLELLRLTRSRGGDVRLYGISLAVADAQEASRLTSVTRIYVRRDQAAEAGLDRPSLANPARSRRGPVGALRSIGGNKGGPESGQSQAPVEQEPARALAGGADR